MRKLIAAVLLLFVLVSATPAEAASEWTYIGTTNQGTVISARTGDLMLGRSTQRDARVWIKMDSERDRTTIYNQLLTLYSVDCPSQTYVQIQVTAYKPDGTTDSPRTDRRLEYVIPGSFMDTAVKLLCADPTQDRSDFR